MKAVLLTLFLIFSGFANAESDFQRLLDKGKKEVAKLAKKSKGGALSNSEIVEGLKEALEVGAQSAGKNGSKVDGFLKNKRIKIPMPSELKDAEKLLKRMGMNKLAADFIESMNRGAEEAAKLAAPIFVDAIKEMTFNDAKKILSGKDNAATKFLRKTSTDELTEAFSPVVGRSLKKVNATKYWGDISRTYNSVNFFKPLKTDLTAYVTEKALDGLFTLMADEEKKIRRDPLGQASAIIRKVFGSQI